MGGGLLVASPLAAFMAKLGCAPCQWAAGAFSLLSSGDKQAYFARSQFSK